MTDTPTEILNQARQKLVEHRRQIVKNMVDHDAAAFINDFLKAQNSIEGIDRALADEKGLAPAPVVSLNIRDHNGRPLT